MEKIKIGRVVEIEGLNIIIEINEKEISEKINFKVGNQVTPVLINKLISIALLNGKELKRLLKIIDFIQKKILKSKIIKFVFLLVLLEYMIIIQKNLMRE